MKTILKVTAALCGTLLAAAAWSKEDPAAGAQLYATHCVACHGAERAGVPPTFPALTDVSKRLQPAQIKDKIKQGGGAAGHNGIRSMIQHIGDDFRRVRIGIGHPGHKDRVTGHVLGNYHKSEMEPLVDLLGAIAAEAPWLADGNDARFVSDIALRLQD